MAGRVMSCDFSCWRDWGPESLSETARGLLQPTPAATRTEAKTNPKILFMAILVQLFSGVIPDSIAGTGMPAFFWFRRGPRTLRRLPARPVGAGGTELLTQSVRGSYFLA